jgi:transposase
LEEEVELLPGSSREPLLQHIASYLVSRERLLDITRKIRTLSMDKIYAQNMELLRSIPGIGFHTAISFLTEMGDISRFSNEKEFASFIGIVPTCHSSGEKENIGEMTFRGNKHVRQQLVECAWKAISKDLALGACYGKYCQRMDENDAIIRIARKLSNRILTVLKTKRKYVNERNH